MEPDLLKALKLFAKNHQQLDRINNPEKGQHRRVLSSDLKASNSSQKTNIPASTYEKGGGTVLKGPKHVNEPVEREL